MLLAAFRGQTLKEVQKETEEVRGPPRDKKSKVQQPSIDSQRIRPRDESRFEPRVQELDDSHMKPPMEVSRPRRALATTKTKVGRDSRHQKDIPSIQSVQQKANPSIRGSTATTLVDSDSDDFVEMKNPMLPTDTRAAQKVTGTIPKSDRPSIPRPRQQKEVPSFQSVQQKASPSIRRRAPKSYGD